MKIILLIGPPCSGKTTWSKKYVLRNENVIRICRDDLRFMLQSKMILQSEIEDIIDNVVYTIIEEAIEKNIDVVLDQTNCKLKYITNIFGRFGNDSNVEIQAKLFYEPLNTLLSRNIDRARKTNYDPIPNVVIETMHNNYKDLIVNEQFKKLIYGKYLV